MSKIKILFDVARLYKTDDKGSYKTGIFWVTYNLLKLFLHDNCFDVTLYTEFMLPKNNIDTVDLNIDNLNYVASKYSLQLKKTKNFIKNKNFNAENYDLYFNSAFLSKLDASSVPQFYVLHDTIPMILKDKYPEIFINNFKNFYNNLHPNTYCLCISESCKNDFLKYFPHLNPENMTIIYNASSQKFKPLKDSQKFEQIKNKYNIEIPQNSKYIFTISNLSDKKKNLCFTIKNFFEFIKTNNVNDLYFILAGYGKDILIEELKQEYPNDYQKYKDKLIFLGYLEDSDVNLLYSNAFYFSFISLYEGFGLPLLEAMSAGVPILTSNTSSIPEVVGECALKISPKDYIECQKAMHLLYTDEKLRNDLIKKGLIQQESFSWKKTYAKIVEKIKEVVNKEVI